MALVSAHFTVDITRYAAALLEADGVGRWSARWRVLRFLFGKPGLFRRLGRSIRSKSRAIELLKQPQRDRAQHNDGDDIHFDLPGGAGSARRAGWTRNVAVQRHFVFIGMN